MPDPVAENPTPWGKVQPRDLDAAVAALAARQHGVVARWQLLALGMHPRSIEHRLARGRLHRVHAGVYAVGHTVLGQRGVWMAAVLAAGERAVLSHWSAASLWGLRNGSGPRSHVTVPRKRRGADTIGCHYAELPDDEITEHEGLPATVPARTVLDLAPSLSVPSLTRMLERAEQIHAWPGPSIPTIVDRYPHRAGAPKLRALIAKPLGFTRSELEARFLHLIDEWGLPRPQTNISIDGHEVDCAWPSKRLIVELDVYATHGSPRAFERDRLRDRVLQLAGWTVIRITDLQLDTDPAAVRRDLSARL